MAFNFLHGTRVSAIAMAAGLFLTACGGGSSDSATATISSASDTGTATDAQTSTIASSAADADAGAAPAAVVVKGDAGAAQPDQTSVVASADATAATAAAATGTALASTSSSTSATSTMSTTPATSTAGSTVVASTPSTTLTSSTSTGATSVVPVKTSTPTYVGTRSAVAINLTGVSYYSFETPTIDIMKRSGAWLTQCSSCTGLASGATAWDTQEEAALALDSNGWVTGLPAAGDRTHTYRSVTTMLTTGGTLPAGQYVVRYDGEGTMTYSGVFSKVAGASTPGRDVIQLAAGTGNGWLTISATTPGNYLRNIRIYMPGGACAKDLTVYAASASACNSSTGAYVSFENFPSTQIWHPQFLQDIKGFRALRFMDWNLTNTVTATTWAQRTVPTARTWSAQTGVPIEAELDLANLVGADAWINVPPYANDDYAANIGTLAATHLTGNSKLDLEYANEPWNYGFVATGWMLNQAKAKWPALVSQGVSPYLLQDSWYAERLGQVCRAAKAGDSQARCVMNAQAAGAYTTNQMLLCTYAASEVGHQCAKDVDVIAIAPYFGGYISQAKLRPTMATWYADADGGLGKLFEEITGQDANGNAITAPLNAAGSGAPAGALALSKSWMVATKAVADSFGLPMWAYEGGQGLVLPVGDTDTRAQALFVAANRDPRMGAAYDRMMSDWKSVSGQTFSYYSHVAAPSAYGMWGLKESMADVSNAKWVSALKNRNAATCNWQGC